MSKHNESLHEWQDEPDRPGIWRHMDDDADGLVLVFPYELWWREWLRSRGQTFSGKWMYLGEFTWQGWGGA